MSEGQMFGLAFLCWLSLSLWLIPVFFKIKDNGKDKKK